MRAINYLISVIFDLVVRIIRWRRSTVDMIENNENYKVDRNISFNRNFDDDYRNATAILRRRLDSKFPDGQYARLRSESITPYDNGESRLRAVDQMSTAIASALRKGASVQEAAEAGAASIDI